MDNEAIIKRITNLEAISRVMFDEATALRKSLSSIQGRASRKGGLTKEQEAKLIAKTLKTAYKKP